MIAIELTNEEAVAFKLFREHQDLILAILESEIHLLRNGNATLSFDDKKLRKIKLEQVVYKS